MKKNIIIFIAFIGLIGILTSCEKDGTQVTMLRNPVAPSFSSFPENLTFSKDVATETVTFIGTPVKPGFVASATYFLEACAKGNNFADAITLYSGSQDTLITFTVSNLNQKLLGKFIEDQTDTIDFRIRVILTVDAGTGAPGTSSDPFEYSSATTTALVYLYGLPRLDLVGSGIEQKIVSPTGNGVFAQYVKLNSAMPFTLYDPVSDVYYGATGTTLVKDGDPISVTTDGWYKLTVDTTAMTISNDPYMVGIIGTFTGWSAPDPKLDYNTRGGFWYITVDLTSADQFKFRLNDDWNNGLNLGLGTLSNLANSGSSGNIPSPGTGTYYITLTIGTSISCSITPVTTK